MAYFVAPVTHFNRMLSPYLQSSVFEIQRQSSLIDRLQEAASHLIVNIKELPQNHAGDLLLEENWST